jgi:alanine racemase
MMNSNILEINLDNIRYNYRYLSSLTKSIIAPVLKANAYGLGMNHVSKILLDEECRSFFVTSIDEASSLLLTHPRADIHIYILNGFSKLEMKEFIDPRIIPVINHLDQLENYSNFAKKNNKILRAILHFDTGMNRLGMDETEIEKLIQNRDLLGSVKVLYIMSHLAIAEDADNPRNIEQKNKLINYCADFPGIPISLANSSGIFLGKDYHFDMVRPGASLYGINPHQNKDNPMKNPVSLKSHILQLRNVGRGQNIGYGNGFVADRDMRIATIPIGYADGYKRVNNNKSYVTINGERAQIVGNVSMDLTTINVTNIPDNMLYIGASVEIIGKTIDQDILGLMQNTIGYEILTSLGNRYKRNYIF